ncbi:MAG: hypothetical protein Q7T61_12955 [Caulobacter sp.]|nr:hypothetical protein [Caulobacter sp.]
MLQWYCVIRHPDGPTPVVGADEPRHWFGLSRVLIERAARDKRTLIEVRAYRDRRRAESDAIAGSVARREAGTASLVEVTAWFPFDACMRSLRPASRKPIGLSRDERAA